VASRALDWGLGRYEGTAAKLLPAARVAVDRALLRPGERVLDVGCGTGNATLLAAAPGARAVGIDPARRLLEVARAGGLSRRHRGSWRPHSAKSGCAAWALAARPLGSSQSSCRPRAVRSRK
jgi:SAM-dependent methyltransferase